MAETCCCIVPVVAAMQKLWRPPVEQSLSEEQPSGVQTPIAQTLAMPPGSPADGLQSLSSLQVVSQVPLAQVDSGLPVFCTHSAFVVQPAVTQVLVVVSQVKPVAQSNPACT